MSISDANQEKTAGEFNDSLLKSFGPQALLRRTVLLAGPTHVAKNNLSAKTKAFGVPAKTIHSAFMTPRYPEPVKRAIFDLDAMYGTFPEIAKARIPDFEARFNEIVELIGKIPGSRLADFRKYLADPDTKAEEALSLVGVNMLELAEGWSASGKEQPILTILDEASMVNAEALGHVRAASALVVVGDMSQLPPVDLKAQGVVKSGIEIAAETAGAVLHSFTQNYRLQAEAPTLVAAMNALREAAAATTSQADRASALRLTFGLLRHSGGGIRFADTLPPDAVEEIVLQKAVALSQRNDTRHRLNDDVRASIGFDTNSVRPGEPVIPALKSHRSPVIVDAVQRAESWRFVRDEFFGGQGSFLVADGSGRDETLGCQYAFEWREDSAYRAMGQFHGCDVTLAFGYVRTVHKAQGRQWPRVYVNYGDVVAHYNHMAAVGQLRSFARWLYTALSRAEREVILFHRVPASLPLDTVERIAQGLAETVADVAPPEPPEVRVKAFSFSRRQR